MARDVRDFLSRLAERSRAVVARHFRSDLAVEWKQDKSPVTVADREVEQLLRTAIREAFPDDTVCGEEYGVTAGTSEYAWWLDPIDGTTSFISGVPLFGTLVALLERDEPVWGMISIPMLDECLIGDNRRAWRNGTPIRMIGADTVGEAVLVATDHLAPGKYQTQRGFDDLTRAVKLYRTWGDCFGYYLVATGRADIMLDSIMQRWDSMAVIPVIRGAGGTVTDWQGRDPSRHWSSLVASNPRLHPAVLSMLNAR